MGGRFRKQCSRRLISTAHFVAIKGSDERPVSIANVKAFFLLPISTWVHYQKPLPLRFWLLLAASILYIVGVMGVTMMANVPMNDALDTFNVNTATIAEFFYNLWRFML